MKPEKSRNQMAEEYGLSSSTVSKQMVEKVLSMGPSEEHKGAGWFTAGRFSSDIVY